jgi:hypothetical protein
VDFAAVSLTAVGIINKLDHCQRGVTSTEGTVGQFERNIKTARSGALLEGAAPSPPRQTSEATPVPTQSPARPPPLPPKPAPDANGETRKPGINYSLKDLAAMRKKKAEDGGEEESNRGPASKPQPPQPAVPVDDGSLPEGWIEKVDKKSGRLYYVHE